MDNEEAGESLFQRLCAFLGVACARVQEAGSSGERRPDFLVTGTDGTNFYAEIKIVSPTPAETDLIGRTLRGEAVVTGGTPGDRVREFIRKANKQLRAVCRDGYPGVLVIFNPEIFLRWHTDPYFVLTAMRGLDVVDVQVPLDPSVQPEFGQLRSGPKRRMTPTDNTTTAAILCPIEKGFGQWQVPVYHNRHAVRRLPISSLEHHAVSHWSMSADERTWTRVE
jgi:hypothetical protein